MLVLRVEDREGLSHLLPAYSSDGVTDWQIASHPLLASGPRRGGHYRQQPIAVATVTRFNGRSSLFGLTDCINSPIVSRLIRRISLPR